MACYGSKMVAENGWGYPGPFLFRSLEPPMPPFDIYDPPSFIRDGIFEAFFENGEYYQ
jgi:hypothetical protein